MEKYTTPTLAAGGVGRARASVTSKSAATAQAGIALKAMAMNARTLKRIEGC
jgi:hypothetical protein